MHPRPWYGMHYALITEDGKDKDLATLALLGVLEKLEVRGLEAQVHLLLRRCLLNMGLPGRGNRCAARLAVGRHTLCAVLGLLSPTRLFGVLEKRQVALLQTQAFLVRGNLGLRSRGLLARCNRAALVLAGLGRALLEACRVLFRSLICHGARCARHPHQQLPHTKHCKREQIA
jgi:hypothetical protein